MGTRVAGQVAFVTGAARGQGRNHAVRLAGEGADIIAVDLCQDIGSVAYPLASADDLAATARLVEQLDRRVVTRQADVRDRVKLKEAVDAGVRELGRLDIVCANAGICSVQSWEEVSDTVWNDHVDINLTGTWNAFSVAAPHLVAGGGGSMVATSSTAGIKGLPFMGPYCASKHGIVGIGKSLANELAKHNIRVNTVHPTGVTNTRMLEGLGGIPGLLSLDPNVAGSFMNALPVEMVDQDDVSNAVLFLTSDEGRHVTGLEFTVDAGLTVR